MANLLTCLQAARHTSGHGVPMHGCGLFLARDRGDVSNDILGVHLRSFELLYSSLLMLSSPPNLGSMRPCQGTLAPRWPHLRASTSPHYKNPLCKICSRVWVAKLVYFRGCKHSDLPRSGAPTKTHIIMRIGRWHHPTGTDTSRGLQGL